VKPTLRLVQVGPHYLVHPVHEQHGIHLARDDEETDPPIVIGGLLGTLPLVQRHHQGSFPSHGRPPRFPHRQDNPV
jgi:hypothetical protein